MFCLRLSNFDEVPVRVLHIAAKFVLVTLRLRKELGTLAFPFLVVALNVGHSNIQKAADFAYAGWRM